MDDEQVYDRINRLASEEEELYARAGAGGGLGGAEDRRLHELEAQLDQCYDLLAQRRARRAAGLNPDEAEVRPIDTVEGYQQ